MIFLEYIFLGIHVSTLKGTCGSFCICTQIDCYVCFSLVHGQQMPEENPEKSVLDGKMHMAGEKSTRTHPSMPKSDKDTLAWKH